MISKFPDVIDIQETVQAVIGVPSATRPEITDINYFLSRYSTKLSYYITRLNNINYSGKKVLDAGCGSGAWSIALSQCYKNVIARDLSDEGLTVFKSVLSLMDLSNIQIDKGELESLPYPDSSFDDIFCYSVIMYCDIKTVLTEFYRILNPGGRVYLCLNSDAYYDYLINERGKLEPEQANYGKKVMYNTLWKRFLKDSDDSKNAINQLDATIGQWCGSEYLSAFKGDFENYKVGKKLSISDYETRAYTYAEIKYLVNELGYINFNCDLEGMLHLNTQNTQVEPLYHGYYNGNITVWECVFEKPV